MTLNISKRNPLNAIYNYWLYLGGKPKTPEDLCHFMRVCFLWSWVRYLLSFDFEIINREEQTREGLVSRGTTFYHQDRLPRGVIFLIAAVLIVLGTELYARGIVLNTLILILGIALGTGLVYGFALGMRGVLRFLKDGAIHEGLRTFRDYSAAKKQRICPFIKVE